MHLRYVSFVLALALGALVLAAACSSGDGGSTPTPTATSQALPEDSTAAREDTTADAPEGFFTYFDNLNGFAISYPKSWTEREFPAPGPVVVITSPESSTRLSVIVAFEESNSALEERAGAIEDEFSQGARGVEFSRRSTLTLEGGTRALRFDATYILDGLESITRFQVAARGSQTYLVAVSAPTASLERYADDVDQAMASLFFFVPSPEGVPADRTLFLAGADPVTMDPAMSRDSLSHQYITQIFSGLVRIDENLRIQPDLAETWSVEGGRVYTFQLREGVTFHDGTPITAEDFKYSIERATDPELLSPTASTYLGDIVGVVDKLEGRASTVRGVEVLSERTLRITIDAPKAYFLAKLTYPTAAVVDRRTVEAGGLDWWMADPNGSGPFKLLTWERGEVLVLDRHQSYLPKPSSLEFAVFRILAGVPMRMYEAGTVDVAQAFGSDIGRALDPDNEFLEELTIYPQLNVFYLGFKASEPPFDDPKVRRAFTMALDREQMREGVFEDRVELAQGILPPGLPGYDPGLEAIPFDPVGALRLIEESSYGSAEALPPIVYTTPGLGALAPDVAFVVDSWRRHLGVEVEVRQLVPDLYFYQLEQEVDNLFDMGWVADYPDPENFLDILFHSQNHVNNPGRYANPEVDRLLEEARTEQDVARRMALYNQAERLIISDAAAIPLTHGRDYLLVKPYVRGFVLTSTGLPVLTGVELGRR